MIRITRLDLARWGHFDGRSLAFAGAGALHVVYGPNEAGKSTTRRAVSALLFGVPARTRDTYGRAGADLRIGALLDLGERTVEVARRKGLKNTLLDAAGEPLDEGVLGAALGGLTAEVHAGLFEITHDSLVEGGQELLAGHGAVGESLFAAAAGTARLHALLRRLEGEADALFSTRPSKKELNLLLARHAEVTKTLRDASLRPPRFEALQRELVDLESAFDAASAALTATERDRAHLERLRGAHPIAADRATRLAELATLADLPTLSSDAPARRIAATERRTTAHARATAAERELDRHRARLGQLALDDTLLASLPALASLATTASSVLADEARLLDLMAEIATTSAGLGSLLSTLSPSLSEPLVEDAARLTLDAGARDRLEQCLRAHAAVLEAIAAADTAVEDTARDLERAEREAASAPSVVNDLALTAALRAARRAGDLDDQIARARAEERTALAAAERAAGGDADALAAVPAPDRETIERLAFAVLDAEQTRASLDTEADAIADRIGTLEAQRDDLGADAPVLDAESLAAARTARDETWAKVRDALTAPLPAEAAEQLAVEHEHTTTEADDIADERLRHAEDVTRLADLERELAKLARDTAGLAQRRNRNTTAITRADAAWSAAWSPAGDAAPTAATAGTWLTRRETTLDHLATATRAAEQADAATRLRAEHVAALQAALAATDSAAQADATAPLATLVELADARLDALRTESDAATRAADELTRARTAAESAVTARTGAQARLDAWTVEWATLRDACGLAATLAPADALGAARALEQTARDQARLADLTTERDAIATRAAAFATAVAEQVTALAPDLADRPAPTAAQELHRRATAADAAASERDALAATIAERETEHAEQLAIVAEADEELATLRAAAGAPDDTTLVQRERDSARAEDLRAEIARLDADLARAGGASATEVAAAVVDLDADAAGVRAGDLAAQAAMQRDARDEAARTLTRARDALVGLERSEEAAQARQEAATLAAQIREVAERYARARLAQRVLRDAIAGYRSAHEGPLLARANQLFPQLTCERFARLETDVDDRDVDVLVAITADGSRRRVEELSDGTREQLFLALRLAAIERHVATAQPVPVIFDDVLLESDDERADRILTALADLARHTQVIVLTHHRHLVEIAHTAIDPSRLDIIDLAAAPSAIPNIEPAPSAADAPLAVPTAPSAADAPPTTASTADALPTSPSTEPDLSDPDSADDEPDRSRRAPSGDPTPTLAEELGGVLTGHAVHESPYGEQTSLL